MALEDELFGGARAPAPPEADSEDDDWLLPAADDKPGFVRWVEALSSRRFAAPAGRCEGVWRPAAGGGGRGAVLLTRRAGKWYATMGRPEGSSVLLRAEEALALLDEGKLLLSVPEEGGAVAVAGGAVAGGADAGGAVVGGGGRAIAVAAGKRAIEPADDGGAPAGRKRRRAEGGAPPAAAGAAAQQQQQVWRAGGGAGGGGDEEAADDGEDDGGGDDERDDGEGADGGDDHGHDGSRGDEGGEDDAVLDAEAGGAGGSGGAPGPPSAVAVAPPPARALSFQDAYMFLAARADVDTFVVYSSLRAAGFVVVMHDAGLELDAATRRANSAGAGAGAGAGAEDPVADGGAERGGFSGGAAGGPGGGEVDAEGDDDDALAADEAPLRAVMDIYARDGVTAFRVSSPGPPDGYVVVCSRGARPPSHAQLRELSRRLARHASALAAARALDARVRKRSALELAAAIGAGGAGAGAGAAGAGGGAPPPISPDDIAVKFAVVAGSVVTFFSVGGVQLAPPAHAARGRNARRR